MRDAKTRKYFRDWYDKNGNRERYNKLAKDKYTALKIECFKAYGNKCSCCGEKTLEFLTLDHIGGRAERVPRDKRKHKYGYYEYGRLKKLGFPKDKYRLLCMNCNFATRGNKLCPHKKKSITRHN